MYFRPFSHKDTACFALGALPGSQTRRLMGESISQLPPKPVACTNQGQYVIEKLATLPHVTSLLAEGDVYAEDWEDAG